MIYLTNEQTQKIELLDRLFSSMSIDDLRQLTETEQVVAKLKGVDTNKGFLQDLVKQHNLVFAEMSVFRGDLMTLRGDLGALIKGVTKPFDYQTQAEMNTLKSKYNVF